ncbi:uncharacterized protein K02A2.6-like [Pecten maximus]|uniref:uncharacterized protein K02A2.6-like n=1 Tax=Pecten maximus TaxID=6579 RepID=UPI001458A2C9|nr:uncharacterized protein K02A2.6-like [Pecten maximus]
MTIPPAQEKGETIDQYVTDLKNKSKSCEFGDLCDSLIKDRIVCGIADVHLRERLLREPNLTLQKTVTICRASELSKSQMKDLADEQEKTVHVVKRPGTSGTGTKQYGSNSAHRGRGRGQNRDRVEKSKCTRCGYEHRNKNGPCPAKGKKCHKCQGMDHFSSMCRTKNVHTVEEDELFIGSIWNIDMVSSDWQTELFVNGHSISLKLDTGAQANVISGKIYDKVKNSYSKLQNSKSKLTTFSGEKIPVRGVVDLKCRYGNKVNVLPFMVVDIESPAVLGLKACEELNLIQRTSPYIHQVKQTNHSILQEYSEVFSGTGCLPDQHHIEIDVTVKPVVHPPRRVPVALRDKLSKELVRMESTGVIEKVDEPSDWVNSMVLVEKPNGKLRICLDPKDLNGAIKREHFPLPTSDEVSSRLSGAKFFSKLDASSGFWQIPLDEESSRLCTFNTPEGRYRFKRLPFGISSAPEVFHKTVRKILDGLDRSTLNY